MNTSPKTALWSWRTPAGLVPKAILVAVMEGRLSSRATSRVVAPLARANSRHAERLVKALSAAPLATRDLRQWAKARDNVKIISPKTFCNSIWEQ
jgi:hypothetical protein